MMTSLVLAIFPLQTTTLLHLLQKLGLDISVKKLIQPCTKAKCLDFELDTTNFTVAVSQEKLANIHKTCTQWNGRKM